MKPRKGTLDHSMIVPVVANGAIAGPVADGKLVPLLILDTSGKPGVTELFRAHLVLPTPGDATHQWASSRDSDDHVALILHFIRPVEVDFAFRFSIKEEAPLVEGMLYSGVVYLQSGKPGDRVASTLNAPRILVELLDNDFRPAWDELLLKRMTVVMAQRIGVPRRKGRPAAEAVIARMKELVQLRMGS